MDFVEHCHGGWAAIGSLTQAHELVAGTAGTRIVSSVSHDAPTELELYPRESFDGEDQKKRGSDHQTDA